jgi:hypothetical protein
MNRSHYVTTGVAIMHSIRLPLACLLVGLSSLAAAQDDIAGTWSGMLPAGPDTTLEIHFVLSRDAAGGYSTVLTSPNPGGIQDLLATSTSFSDGQLVIAVDDLAGRYEGTVANGRISGECSSKAAVFRSNSCPTSSRCCPLPRRISCAAPGSVS